MTTVVLIVTAGAVVACLPFAVSQAVRDAGARPLRSSYLVASTPWPTLAAETIRTGCVIGVERRPVGDSPAAVARVRVLDVRHGVDVVAVDHLDPDGCPLGIHAECRTTSVFRPGDRVRWFPPSATPGIDT